MKGEGREGRIGKEKNAQEWRSAKRDEYFAYPKKLFVCKVTLCNLHNTDRHKPKTGFSFTYNTSKLSLDRLVPRLNLLCH